MNVDSLIVFIARSEIAAILRKRFGQHRNVAVFRESDSLDALQLVLTRRPDVIALDPAFTATSRGAALITRVRSEAEVASTDLRLLSIDDRAGFIRRLQELPASPDAALSSLSRPLEWCGTRRTRRFAITAEAPAAVNGEPTQLVNLSASGVQLISSGRLRPTQAFRLTLSDEEREARLQAVVAWSTFEGSGSAPAYRAGAEFVDSDQEIIEVYCKQYGTSLDQILVAPPEGGKTAIENVKATPARTGPPKTRR